MNRELAIAIARSSAASVQELRERYMQANGNGSLKWEKLVDLAHALSPDAYRVSVHCVYDAANGVMSVHAQREDACVHLFDIECGQLSDEERACLARLIELSKPWIVPEILALTQEP